MDSFSEVFSEVLKYCYSLTNANRISEQGYKMWIEPLEPVKMEKNVVYLAVSSVFMGQTVMQAYGNTLKEAFEKVLGFPVEIKMVTKSKDGETEEKNESDIDIGPSEFSEYNTNNLTFENFVQGESNKLAFAFCHSVAHRYDKDPEQVDPNTIFNPLIIYGDSGLGKTHLLKAIEHEVKKVNPEMNIIYTTGESFINELVKALQFQDTIKFHEKYRNADYLLVDDIQTISGKDRMQEEFFHTFNDLYNAGKQIILTSDIIPSKITKLQERIRNRFALGVMADVGVPDLETRMAIIKRKADMLDLELSDSIISLIANKLQSNVRQLEGTVKRLKALSYYTKEAPSISMTQRVIKEISIENHPAEITTDRVIEEVANAFDVTPEEIKGKHRHSNISSARKVAIYVLKEVKGMTYTNIGKELGKNHSTMTLHYKDVVKEMNENPKIKETIDDIIKNLKEK